MSSIREAQQVIERILADDAEFIAQIRGDQREIAFHFSDEYCRETWKQELQHKGFMQSLREQARASTVLRELKRTLLTPFAHGRLRITPHKSVMRPPRVTLTADAAEQTLQGSLFTGIRFSDSEFPEFVDYVSGVSGAESWGRWSNGETIAIVLKHNLVGEFRLCMRAVGFRKNAEVPVPVRIGNQVRNVQLPASIDEGRGAWLHFSLKEPTNVIAITVPQPTRPEMDGRTIGVGLIALHAALPVSMGAVQAREAFGASLEEGIDFAAPMFPAFVDSTQGLSVAEPWGRWSSGDKVVIELRHTLHGRFQLLLRAVAYGRNAMARITVRIGSEVKTFRLPRRLSSDTEVSIEFNLLTASNVIEFSVPYPTLPPKDDRAVGIGFYRMRYRPLGQVEASAIEAKVELKST